MLGRILLTLSALAQGITPFIADFNHTHIYNPRWPPHAKFHNGQTLSMGAGLCLITLYYTWRFPAISNSKSNSNPKLGIEKKQQAPESSEMMATRKMTRDSMITAAIAGTLYWVAGLSAILYPGSKAIDPEFGDGFPQAIIYPIFAVMAILGAWVEVKGLERV
ncbi:hypothetical protein SBOR_9220 [Sclerotinia borealis F-4128]|uniref:Uncharacterized protein n=1 Tax=Sclerotinia borealis (strain F-4128) TaxID=1432307 RepID=W9C667_SCLBF|nr:hypothetical protein SBOR_9220 [Sclerotinia borealis F-4128]